jgi:site-specific recombinase XerD
MAGIDITPVKELLGHETLAITLRYAHLAPGHKAKAVSVLEEMLEHRPTIQFKACKSGRRSVTQ